MIIFRYLCRELLLSTFAVTSVLLLVVVSGRFAKYLGQAAAGELDADVLFLVIGLRMPGFLQLVLPLGFFIGVLLSYGRAYMDSEMTVLSSCGMSQRRLVGYTLIPALLIATLVGWLSLDVGPYGQRQVDEILALQKQRSSFDMLTPGRFQQLQNDSQGQTVIYVEGLSGDRQVLEEVFIAKTESQNQREQLMAVLAKTGVLERSERENERYLVLKQGYRYQGQPGEPNYRVTQFSEYGQRLANGPIHTPETERDGMATIDLWASDDLRDQAALQWRLSLPCLVLVVALMAVPLSRTSPRQGRYQKLIPAILLYIIYLVSLSSARSAVEEGRLALEWGMWSVHGLFLTVAVVLNGGDLWRFIPYRQMGRES